MAFHKFLITNVHFERTFVEMYIFSRQKIFCLRFFPPKNIFVCLSVRLQVYGIAPPVLSVCLSVCWVFLTFVPTIMHLAWRLLSACKVLAQRDFAPSTHPPNNEPVPQVLKQVVNLSCLAYNWESDLMAEPKWLFHAQFIAVKNDNALLVFSK